MPTSPPSDHSCEIAGCGQFGGHGLKQTDGTYRWRCREHLWPDFFAARDALLPVRERVVPTPGALPKQGALL
ncbi:hypothetical protein [Telmatospirillum sp. J64-1]|uniref:hypothetical protein n=1 Tax=Telmatospirillum sp. J64-1 TaxID=2502183 RepID=UPI00115D72AE|nr:hypothetical protein [Telmatospirillum sp. J64-1]